MDMVKKVAAFDLSEAKAGVIRYLEMAIIDNQPQVISNGEIIRPNATSLNVDSFLTFAFNRIFSDSIYTVNQADKFGFAINGRSVFFRRRIVPAVEEEKVAQIASYEIQQQMPFALEETCLDYNIIDRTEGGGYELLLAAVKAENTFPLISEIVPEGRFECVDVSIFALFNRIAYDGFESGHIVYLRLGEETSDIVMINDGKFNFARCIGIGKKHLAENANEHLSRLAEELSRTLHYYRSTPGGNKVQKIYLMGEIADTGLANLDLDKSISQNAHIEEYKLKRLIEMPGMTETPEMAVVMGLGLRLCGLAPLNINLKSNK